MTASTPSPSTTPPDSTPEGATRRRRSHVGLDDDALDAILGADLASDIGESLGEAFDVRRSVRLRRRAAWYFGTLGVVALAGLPLEIITLARTDESAGRIEPIAAVVTSVLVVTAMASLVAWVLVRRPARRLLLRTVTASIVAVGTTEILAETFLGPGVEVVPFRVLGVVLTAHLAASLFLPWTPRECARPLPPLLLIFAAVTLAFSEAGIGLAIAAVLACPLAGAPGMLVCTWRHARERQQFLLETLQSEVRETRRDTAVARAIHESMLPSPIHSDALRLHFAFEPVRDLGGDFVVVHRGTPPAAGEAPVTVVLLDVTGHGVAAALGATRLHGEIERTLEADPDVSPAALLAAANTACRRILAPHAIFATAFAARLMPADGTLEWASAGHLPGMILRGPSATPNGGTDLVRLPATTTMLGVFDPSSFDAGRRRERIGRGDRLILVTDGIVEARTQSGQRLEQGGTERLVRRAAGRRGIGESGSGRFPARLLRAVERYSEGPAEDDRVVVELTRPA